MTVLTTPDHERAWLTVADVAAELAWSEPSVRRRIRAGELPAVQLGGRGRSALAGMNHWGWACYEGKHAGERIAVPRESA